MRLIIVGDGDYDMYLRECLDIGSKVTLLVKFLEMSFIDITK